MLNANDYENTNDYANANANDYANNQLPKTTKPNWKDSKWKKEQEDGNWKVGLNPFILVI